MPLFSKASRPGSSLLAATLSLVALAAGCGSDDDSSQAGPAGTTSTTAEVTVPISATTVRLTRPGDEPREVLQRRPAVDVAQQVRLTTGAEVFQRIDDQPVQDFSSPEITVPLTAVVTRPTEDADGAIALDLTLGAVTSPDSRLASALEASKGSGAGFTFDSTGAITALRLRPAAESQDIARSAIEQAFYQAVYRTIAFPAEPVGIGAQWTIHQKVMSGIALDQTTVATLTARDGNRVTIDYTVDQTPQSPIWQLPGEAGTLNVDQYVMRGAGTTTVDLGLPLPVAGTVTVSGEQQYSDPEGATLLRQTTSNRVQWGS
ncbi:hypothetical protein CBI38_12515 [Rhodococcus oxybenzonivorans]|uniref:Lipoprotein n=1 Tax=Rhodococcus oxybenzonivorans TaxID=1990687 RepID=A0A2S2BUN1_9NOCA|nr:hypothetical protein [Rhodococcus oxybenzonivorans]AWK72274.1 hypothetical protein CBI38_12515 [Rhodococcus oxybenzonivorans]